MRIILFTSLLVSSVSFAQMSTRGPELSCQYLSSLEKVFVTNHVKQSVKDKDLEAKVVDQYIKKIDSTKIYLTQSDVDKMRSSMKNLFELTKKADCQFLEDIQKTYVARVKERVQFAKTFLGKDYKFDDKTEIMIDPDKRTYAKTTEELTETAKKYIHFQVSNYLVTKVTLDEAKENVIKNYDRLLKRVNETKVVDLLASYMDAYARGFDPHSSFFSREALEDFEIDMSLSLEGIGATLSSQDGFTVVEALVPGGAASKSNMIEPQDKIIAVGQGAQGKMENVVDVDLKDVVRKIRGAKGTTVTLTILRKTGDGKKTFDVVLVRDKIKLEDQAANIYYQDKVVGGVKKKIGIINLPSFYAGGGRSSAADMKKLVQEAARKKVDGLILDFSQNGGGSLDDAVKIAGLFFKTGNVVKQSGRPDIRSESSLKDIDPTVDYAGPLVVLTSRVSASASEIVAGTLKDYKRAVIVGNDHTFGKGTVQQVMPLQTLGAIKVTVGMFYTPGGNSTQHIGVNSDVVIPGPYTSDEIGEKSLDYSLPPTQLPVFISADAYVKEGSGAWKEINPETVKVLQEKSQARVQNNADFKKIIEELAKNAAKDKTLKVSEVLKGEQEEKKNEIKKSKNLSKDEKSAEYLKRADVNEAANVLVDLISSYSLPSKKLAKDAKTATPVTQSN